jgi:hypothetical protein
MRANGGAVDHLDVTAIGDRDGAHHSTPYACLSPSLKAVVAGGARAIALRTVTPRRAGSQHPENAVQHATVIDTWYTWFVGQKWFDHAPLKVGQVISAC